METTIYTQNLNDLVTVEYRGNKVQFNDLSDTEKVLCVMDLQSVITKQESQLRIIMKSYSKMNKVKQWLVKKMGLEFERPMLMIMDEAHRALTAEPDRNINESRVN